MIAYLVAIFLLGFLAGAAFGFYNAERDRERKDREAQLWRDVAERQRR